MRIIIVGGGEVGYALARELSRDNSLSVVDLEADVAETRNVQAEHPDVVAHLTALMTKLADDGRSTPGRPQANQGPVDIWKAGREAHRPLTTKKGKKA